MYKALSFILLLVLFFMVVTGTKCTDGATFNPNYNQKVLHMAKLSEVGREHAHEESEHPLSGTSGLHHTSIMHSGGKKKDDEHDFLANKLYHTG